jgi:hypothetical protein
VFEVSGAYCTQERRAFVQDGMQHEADAESLEFELCALGHFSDESDCIGKLLPDP